MAGGGESDADDDAVGAVGAPPAIDFPAEVSDPKYDGETGMTRAVPGLAVRLGSPALVVPESHLRPQAASVFELGPRPGGHREAAVGPSRVRSIFIPRASTICPLLWAFIILGHCPEAAFHLHALTCFSSPLIVICVHC